MHGLLPQHSQQQVLQEGFSKHLYLLAGCMPVPVLLPLWLASASTLHTSQLTRMWRQVSLEAEDIRNEKVKVLRCMKAMSMDDVVLGQYRARSIGGTHHKGYLDDPTVPAGRYSSVLRTSAWVMPMISLRVAYIMRQC